MSMRKMSAGKLVVDVLDRYHLRVTALGTHKSDDGHWVHFDDRVLNNIATYYNQWKAVGYGTKPLATERYAPITVGVDAGQYGKVGRLYRSEQFLMAEVVDLSDGIRGGILSGKYPRYQPVFLNPDSPENPIKGAWFLKELNFLGPPPQSLSGDIRQLVSFMETLGGSGRKVETRQRSRGAAFAEFASWPTTASDIGLMARSLVDSHGISLCSAVDLIMRAPSRTEQSSDYSTREYLVGRDGKTWWRDRADGRCGWFRSA